MAGTTCCGQERYDENQRPKGDRRVQLIDQIKTLIGDMEKEGKGKKKPINKNPGARIPMGVRDMEEECRQYRKRRECSPPTITSIALHEIRPTSDYSNMQHENSSQVTYVDATKQDNHTFSPMPPAPWELPRTPSQELRAGTLYQNCECAKRNGLQLDCPRWECGGRPECVATSPGPCCEPSQARKPVRGDRRGRHSATRITHPSSTGPSRTDDFCICEQTGTGAVKRTPQTPPRVEVVQMERQYKQANRGVTPNQQRFIGVIGISQTPLSSSTLSPSGTPDMVCFCSEGPAEEGPGQRIGQGTPQAPQQRPDPNAFFTMNNQAGQYFLNESSPGARYLCCPIP